MAVLRRGLRLRGDYMRECFGFGEERERGGGSDVVGACGFVMGVHYCMMWRLITGGCKILCHGTSVEKLISQYKCVVKKVSEHYVTVLKGME